MNVVRKKVSSASIFADSGGRGELGFGVRGERLPSQRRARSLPRAPGGREHQRVEAARVVEGARPPLPESRGDGAAVPRLPASTSATVERLFSAVGLAYSNKRQSGTVETLANIIFTKENLE